ncbi:long-chain fatty acid--CoA ligase [Solemya pervernicosa gill symbiont]|uniref:Long-chain fatty acid--CoA ligase n=1 Tax=Solemya pervernicosa gill symbiont TaxID=642797 RepID=A0A1T2KZX9_9GAMM|nr:long-chain fatty acid--CoA ligase [Solemya pervernicosa gill symbiont]OOZ38381.1 long-chain fatty acid--CoA ligase [Solemya pervernicosa gill symbiont]
MKQLDLICPGDAGTLAGLFRERVEASPDKCAYIEYDREAQSWRNYSWQTIADEVARWQAAMKIDGLKSGDRIALMLHNGRHWVIFDQAALGLGLVTVPLYVDDNPGNIAFILHDAGVRLLLVERDEQWQALHPYMDQLDELQHVVTLQRGSDTKGHLRRVDSWLPEQPYQMQCNESGADELATIVYTSGTTGQPKGVMLSHRNILFDAFAGVEQVQVYEDDLFLSFLPLSHTLERTAGYYIPVMTGATVAFSRSIEELAEDLQVIRPTVLVSVPRIFERIFNRTRAKMKGRSASIQKLFEWAVTVGWARFQHRQHRALWSPQLLLWPLLKLLVANKLLNRLGGRLRLAISGGAPLSPAVSHAFVGLGVPLLQGYGLTESSPVISVNSPKDNLPESVGTPLPGVETRVDERGELLVRGPNIMLGYWHQPQATREMIDSHGWLHTGDLAAIDAGGHLHITGRVKEIIVLSNGEKVSPADMELTLSLDPLFEQVMIVGEGRPYLSALCVMDVDALRDLARELDIGGDRDRLLSHNRIVATAKARLVSALGDFPGYAKIRRITLIGETWSIENGLMTPTLKVKRDQIEQRYHDQIERMYAGHESVQA